MKTICICILIVFVTNKYVESGAAGEVDIKALEKEAEAKVMANAKQYEEEAEEKIMGNYKKYEEDAEAGE